VVSREAARMLGFKSPEDALDKTAYSGKQPLHIVGVIETLRFRSPKGELLPMYYYFYKELKNAPVLAVRYDNVSESRSAAA